MLAAAKNLGDEAGGMDDLLVRLRAREKARHGLQVRRYRRQRRHDMHSSRVRLIVRSIYGVQCSLNVLGSTTSAWVLFVGGEHTYLVRVPSYEYLFFFVLTYDNKVTNCRKVPYSCPQRVALKSGGIRLVYHGAQLQ